jgi:hypothetical protein
VAALAHEHEQRARPGLRQHPLADQRAESLRAEAHIDRLERHIDRQPVRNHGIGSASAAMTSRKSAWSKPGRTSTITSPTRTVSELGPSVAGISRANVGAADGCRIADRDVLPGMATSAGRDRLARLIQ